MSQKFRSFVVSFQNSRKILALLGFFLILSCVYPSRRFHFEYAIWMKSTCALLTFTALFYLSKQRIKTSLIVPCAILGVLSFSFCVTTLTSLYPVRAGSELDILLTSFSFGLLFCLWSKEALEKNIKLLGVFVLIFMHFSVCLTLACEQSHRLFTYPSYELFFRYFFNLIVLLSSFRLDDLRSPFEYSNYAGLFGSIAWPFFVGLWQAEKHKLWKFLWGLGVIYGLSITYVSHSRAGFLVSSLIVLVLLVLLFIKFKKVSLKTKIVVATLTLLTGSIILLSTPRFEIIRTNLANLQLKKFARTRYYAAQDGLKIAFQKPFWGHGITTTPLHYLESEPEVVHHCWQLHVAPVQFLIEFGFVGGLCFLAFFMYIAYCSIKIFASKYVPSNYKNIALGCALSFLAYLISLSESSWDVFCIACFFCLMCGIIVTIYQKFCDKSRSFLENSILLKSLLPMAVIVCFVFSVEDVLGRYYFRQFAVCLSRKQEEKAFNYADKALQKDFLSLRYLNQIGYVFTKMGYNKDKNIIRKAVKFYEDSLSINPNQIELLESLGALYIYLDDVEQGIHYYCQAIKCLPANTATYIQLLDTLKRFKQNQLYTQWLGFLAFINPMVLFSQPDLTEDLRKDKEAQKLCLNYFDYIEGKYPDDDRNDAWFLEKYLREKLFYQKAKKLNLKSYDLLRWVNWMRGLNWETIISTAKKQPLMKCFYFMPLDQHSDPNILLHGCERHIGNATLRDVYQLFPTSICVDDYDNLSDYMRKTPLYVPSPRGLAICDSVSLCLGKYRCYAIVKHARELVAPLLEKTMEVAKNMRK